MNIGLAAAILAVIVVRRFNRIAGSILAVLVTIGIGVYGTVVYQSGTMAFPFPPAENGVIELSQPVFYGIIGTWFLIEAVMLVRLLKNRPRDSEEQL